MSKDYDDGNDRSCSLAYYAQCLLEEDEAGDDRAQRIACDGLPFPRKPTHASRLPGHRLYGAA